MVRSSLFKILLERVFIMSDVTDDMIREHPDESNRVIRKKTDIKDCLKSIFIMVN